MDLTHILLVDDDATMLEIERFQLGEEGFRYSTAENGEQALARIEEDSPNVILLDIKMPVMDGLETCRRIRANPDNDGVSIIFVTSKDDAETRNAAYEAGGDDVLVKPLDPAEILAKVQRAIKSARMVDGLRQEMADTQGVLMSTIITSGEYGVVMNFFRESYSCRSIGELAENLLKAMDDFGLKGSVQLRADGTILTLNSERRSSPLEQEMLLNLSLENRHIYDYGSRSAFCYPNVAVLVKTMPLDDPDSYGRVKDNMALLAEGAEFRLRALQDEIRVRNQREALLASVAQASGVLAQVDNQYRRGQADMNGIFFRLEQELEFAFTGMGLTEGQERSMWAIVMPLIREASDLYESGVQLDKLLGDALEALKQSLAKGDVSPPKGSA